MLVGGDQPGWNGMVRAPRGLPTPAEPPGTGALCTRGGAGRLLGDCGRRPSTQDGGRTPGSVPPGAADSPFGEGPVGACDTLTGRTGTDGVSVTSERFPVAAPRVRMIHSHCLRKVLAHHGFGEINDRTLTTDSLRNTDLEQVEGGEGTKTLGKEKRRQTTLCSLLPSA